MIRINLLDWREAQRQERQKQFFIALAIAAFVGAAIAYTMNAKVVGDVDFQKSRNARLKQEISLMDKQIKEIDSLEKVKADLLARMRIIEELQRSRTEIVHFFDELVTTAPAGLYLKSLQQKDRTTSVNGVAESNGRVSTYIRNLDGSLWFEKSRLIVIQSQKDNRRRHSDFQLQFQASKKKEEDGQ